MRWLMTHAMLMTANDATLKRLVVSTGQTLISVYPDFQPDGLTYSGLALVGAALVSRSVCRINRSASFDYPLMLLCIS